MFPPDFTMTDELYDTTSRALALLDPSSGRGGGGGVGRGRSRGRGGAGRGGFAHTWGTGRGGYRQRSGPPRSGNWRQHLSPSGMPAASSAYLDVSTKESNTVAPDQAAALEPLTLVFGLNHTLISRSAASTQASRDPVKRPYLSTFLSYLFSASGDSEQGKEGRRKLKTVVFTGTRAHNVLSILKSIDLVAHARTTRFGEPYHVDSAEGDLPDLVLSREDMDLGGDYYKKVDTFKDLGRVWSKFGINEESGAKHTVLMSDDAVDAVRSLERSQYSTWLTSTCAIIADRSTILAVAHRDLHAKGATRQQRRRRAPCHDCSD